MPEQKLSNLSLDYELLCQYTGGKYWNKLQKKVSVFCFKGTSGNPRGRSKG